MPPLVIPDTVRVNMIWSLTGQEYAVNVLHYIVPAGQVVSGTTASDLAVDIGNAFGASTLDNDISTDVELTRVTVRDIRSANQPEYNAPINAGGLSVGHVLPLQVSLCATLRTALAGRSYRGRYYQAGYSESVNDPEGIAAATAPVNLEGFLTGISAPSVQGNLWQLGVMSQVLGETNPVTTIDVRDRVWDTQRRRAVPGI